MASSTVVKQGYLVKCGEKRKTWKKRFFVLSHDSTKLKFTYAKSPTSDPLGTFYLKDALCFRVVEPPFSQFADKPVAEVITPNRTYLLTSDNETDLREWAWAIEKSVAYLRDLSNSGAESPSEVSQKCGFLMKKGGQRRNWKKRWFMLQDKSLHYYSARPEKRKAPLGTIDLRTCLCVNRLVNPVSNVGLKHIFTIDTPNRIFQIAAADEVELVDWLRALERLGCPITHTKNARSNSVFYQTVEEEEGEGSESESGDETSTLLLEAQVSDAKPLIPSHKMSIRKPKKKGEPLVPGDIPDFDSFDTFAALHDAFRPDRKSVV